MPEHRGRSIEDDIRERVAASPFHASMGISVSSAREGAVDLVLEARPDHANLHGTVHGGVLATLADTAAGVAVSVNLDIQYLAPATTGTLLASGRVVKLGRRLAFAEAEVTAADGTTVARAQVTVALSPPEAPAAPQ